jgi:hypothetical protein
MRMYQVKFYKVEERNGEKTYKMVGDAITVSINKFEDEADLFSYAYRRASLEQQDCMCINYVQLN